MAWWILAIIIYISSFFGLIAGYILALMNINTGREEEYQRGFDDGRMIEAMWLNNKLNSNLNEKWN